MNKSDEQRLIKRAAAGDRAGAEDLVKYHQRSLYAYMVRMSGRPDVAEDIVQEAFVRVLTNLDRFDPKFRFSTWLFTIARRLYINHAERKRPMAAGELCGSWMGKGAAPEAPPEQDESGRAARDELQRGLMKLSIDQREVLVLFHQHEWPIWLIAEHLGMPEGTIKSHLHRGRQRLREVLIAMNSQAAAEVAESSRFTSEVRS